MKHISLIILFLFVKKISIGQVEKRGYIDYDKVLQASSYYDSSQKKGEALTQLYRDSLDKIQLNFNKTIALIPHSSASSDSTKTETT